MEFASDFTAIDFETASRRSDSACQLAAVVVRAGKIVDERMWMIRPEPFYFSPGNIRIHGIRPERVESEPDFSGHWEEISGYLTDGCLVAHNAAFDMNVLLGCLARHKISVPELEFTCTRLIARRTWPGRRRYGLKPLSEWLGVRFRHHDALEDSIACAKVLLAAGIEKKANDLPSLERRLRIGRGKAGTWGITHPGGKRSSNGKRSAQVAAEDRASYDVTSTPAESRSLSLDLQRLLIRAEFIQPLRGHTVVFSGKLNCMSRDEAMSLTQRCGGKTQMSVDGDTSCLIVGTNVDEMSDSPDSATGPEQAEMDAARALAKSGHKIQIMNEAEFIGLVTSTNAASG
ncbi:exonuclease domain-containing protein [Stieleria varia]|uniref:DNA polymerase III PolC-type n=1 Tax=Stieleria varia TaxID=2528005 RepID=A0A5C6BBD8_9BACT|nr:exonuclease domain-containing protein [Stieleria varia]TWU08579.1 DNA polymerase III PolC-type [Stieleria varia]